MLESYDIFHFYSNRRVRKLIIISLMLNELPCGKIQVISSFLLQAMSRISAAVFFHITLSKVKKDFFRG